ncbi:Zinc finger BED domain-containing protein 4 [Merluccius polli]|uniref:Zinc finger BED domain-containing protein 4 n=1 Tax=Merluccius polli TaxID=89951 RepID=A0AA47M1C1_MERPO|nr:Zinc finger BED domain-containing protein 4 [Merluccius polli]
MERTKGSVIWRYFNLTTPTSATAICNGCKVSVARGGGSTSKYNTTNLIKHLQKHHAKEHEEFQQLNRSKGTSGDGGSTQLTLAETLQRREKIPNNSVKAMKITDKVLEFIVLDGLPMSSVEKLGFQRLMDHLEPRYNIPSRKYFSETALQEKFKKSCELLSKEIKDIDFLSFTTDIWSSEVCPMSLLSLTVHWFDTHMTPRSAALQAKNFPGSHNSDRISAAIKAMLDEWNIPLNKVHVILRDNARNMEAAMVKMGVRSLGCFAHTLQLVVNEGLLSQRSVSDAVANGRSIVKHFKKSPLAYSELQGIQVQMQMQPKRLQQDVRTRWNSTYLMIQSLLEQKRVLGAYVADFDLPTTLTTNQWGLLEKTSVVLEPFEELTRKISSSTASTADVIPAITVLKRILSREGEADAGIRTMKKTLLDAVNRRFVNTEQEPLYSIATVLDPRYKDRYFRSEAFAVHAKDALLRELQERELSTTAEESTETLQPAEKAPRREAETAPEQEAEAGAAAPRKSFMEEFEQMQECEDEGAASSSSAEGQLNAYLTEKTIAASDNPYHYWNVNKHRLPVLAATARKYLCAPCTSVESERLFSTVSNIVDEKRNRLTAERAEMLVFLTKNLSLQLN